MARLQMVERSAESDLSLQSSLEEADKWRSVFAFKDHFEVCKSHEVLQNISFVGDGNRLIWFLCRQKQKLLEDDYDLASYSVKKKRGSSMETTKKSDLDVTGSPLKCSFTLDDDDLELSLESLAFDKKKGEYVFLPMTPSEARSNVSKFVFQTRRMRNNKELRPFWALCDGNDHEGTILVGAEWHLETITLHKIVSSGPYSLRDPSLKMEKLMKKHLSESLAKTISLSEAFAIFKLADLSENNVSAKSLGDCIDDSEEKEGSEIKIHLNWSNPIEILEIARTVDTRAKLEVKLAVGDAKMPTYEIWQEIFYLSSFVNGLDNREILWRGVREDEDPVYEELLKLLEIVRTEGPRRIGRKPREETLNSTDIGSEDIADIISTSRIDCDFTDLLWKILYKSESYGKLCSYFTEIFRLIKDEKLRPHIYPGSSTRVGQIIHSIVRGGSSIPAMNDKLPLELLVEIGIEKLKRDYMHALMASCLTENELSSLTKPMTLKENLLNLKKLHIVYELVALLQMYLSPTQDTLRKIVLQILDALKTKTYSTQDTKIVEEFQCDVPIMAMKGKIANLNPSTWACKLISGNCTTKLATTAHLSVDPPIDFLQKNVELTEEKSLPYFYTVHTEVTRNAN